MSRGVISTVGRRIAPDRIAELRDDEIFVFGSNLADMHGDGAVRMACRCFGAVWGQGWFTGTELCHSDHAGRDGDHPSLCG